MIDNITSDEAKEVIVSLAIRAKQNGMDENKRTEITALGRKLAKRFTREFDWENGFKKQNAFDYHSSKIQRVKVKGQ